MILSMSFFDELPQAIDKVINHENTGRIIIDFNASK